ncbi:MAG: PIG-L family deacetylase [Opitutales bacterium]
MDSYHDFITEWVGVFERAKAIPRGQAPIQERLAVGGPKPPKALIFSPHPDDECIIGGLPLRLMRELGMDVVNVAVTQGSRKDRQDERWEELCNACDYLGFGLVQTGPGGLENVNIKTRENDYDRWFQSVEVIAGILEEHEPAVVFTPHEDDWNSTHIGTSLLVVDALREMESAFSCLFVETEFWGAMSEPNLMVESSPKDVGDLVTALSFHEGEVNRNPYHLRLPAWMQDNVRRGSELVGGQGGASPDFVFATLYRLQKWEESMLTEVLEGGTQLSHEADLKELFPFTKSGK